MRFMVLSVLSVLVPSYTGKAAQAYLGTACQIGVPVMVGGPDACMA